MEDLKTTSNDVGRQWVTGLMRDTKKWTRVYDNGGRRYEFQTSNMVESFNNVLKGIRVMPGNTIVAFTFYKLVAWFKKSQAHAMSLQSQNKPWAPNPENILTHKEKKGSHT